MASDFRKLYTRFHNIKNKFDPNGIYVPKKVKQAAELYINQVKENIEQQVFDGANRELTKRYYSFKVRKNLDTRILISSGEYVRGLTVFKIGKARWFAGPNPKRKHFSSGLRFIELASMLEYGTHTSPARPHLFAPIEQTREERMKLWKD